MSNHKNGFEKNDKGRYNDVLLIIPKRTQYWKFLFWTAIMWGIKENVFFNSIAVVAMKEDKAKEKRMKIVNADLEVLIGKYLIEFNS